MGQEFYFFRFVSNRSTYFFVTGLSFILSACLKEEQRAVLGNTPAHADSSEAAQNPAPNPPTAPTPVESLTPGITSSDDITEGTLHLYYTDARVDSRIANQFQNHFNQSLSADADHIANSSERHSAMSLGVANGLSLTNQQLSLGLATPSTTGALSAADFQSFSQKESSLGTPSTSGQVLTSTTGGVRSWTHINTLSNPIRDIVQMEDWITGSYLGSLNWTRTVNGPGAAANMHPTTPVNLGRPGILELTTGTTATGRANMTIGANTMQFGSGAMELTGSFFLPNLSDVSQNYVFRFGFGDQNSNADFVDGVYFEYNSSLSNNWLLKTATNSSRTTFDSQVLVAANSWVKFTILVNDDGTNADFYINGTLVRSETATIPLGDTRRHGPTFVIAKTVGTTARRVLNDYILFKQNLVVDR